MVGQLKGEEPSPPRFDDCVLCGESAPRPCAFVADLPENIVRDIKASLDYYVRVLGFEKAEWVTEESAFAMVSRDGFGIYLSENPNKHSKAHVWIGAEDIGPLHEEFMAAGAHIEKPPANYSWAYEMVVEDPDGHALRIGSDPKKDVPFND